MKRGLLLAAAVLVVGCQSPPHRPRILSVQTPGGMPPAPPLTSSRNNPILVPSAQVGARTAVAVPAVPVVPAVPGPAVGVPPEPPPGAAIVPGAPPVQGVGPAPPGAAAGSYPPPANPARIEKIDETKAPKRLPVGAPSDQP